MARSTIETDSGSYVNGVYTSKNGNTRNGGLNCPKGMRLYDPNMRPAIFFQPDDTGPTEQFEMITREVAPDILPYYAISNYGRILNINTGQIMKPNYRPNGYEYTCLAAENCKYGQKKYTTHRLVLQTFEPVEGMDKLQVNHINRNKADNYVNKTMPDGTIESNIEWNTPKQNAKHRAETEEELGIKLSLGEAKKIRDLHDQGYSYEQIRDYHGFDFISISSIQNICRNKAFRDPLYKPAPKHNYYKLNPGNVHRLSDSEANAIRELHKRGYNCKQIKEEFFPTFSVSTISDIVRGISHNR